MKEDQERTPLRTILQNFINHIESLETDRIDDSYEKEFQELKFFSEILKTSKQYHCSEGEKEVNRKKNRYKDILPFDNSRVILEEYVGVPGSDYINANFIKGASGSPAYIASQGPLPHTVNDFWRLVVECEVQVIVMACNQEEAGKHKCENYWVENEGEEKQFGMVTIRLLKASIVCPDFLVRTMLLKYTTGRGLTEERTVCQFHYSAWPDHGVPPLVRPLLDMVRLVRDTQASETLPVLVHCSAGCGRTGTICAIDYVFGLLRAGKLTKDFSLYTLVRDMRKQRIAMVQTKEQYVLVHQAVRELFCEQLRMIDAHPYENIDANGMPLIKEPMYDTITSCSINQEENAEKQDEKEKEKRVGTSTRDGEHNSSEAPPLPHKKKLHLAASKQEKEVENLTEKRRCAVEQSSGSDSGSVSSGMGSLLSRPRIAKLKALFERNSSARESRNNRGRRHGNQQVTRSHSLGPVRKTEGDPSNSEWRPIPGAGILRVPQLSSTPPTTKPALPVKRSKSLRVMGSGERQQLSVLITDTRQEGPSAQTVDRCDDVLVKNKCVASIIFPSVSDKKPSVPPKALLTSRDVETSDYLGTQARTSRDGTLQQQAGRIDHREIYTSRQPGPSGWRSYENVPVPLRRRHSLESVILEDITPSVDLNIAQRADYVNVRTPPRSGERKFHSPNYMDKGARKLLQDCRDYLINSFHPSSQVTAKPPNEKHSCKPDEDVLRNDQLKHLSLEAQRKVKAIVAGLGVRERRNSFRQAVDTCRDHSRVRGRLTDYESIWPGINQSGGTDCRNLNKIWLEDRKEMSRTHPTTYNSTYPFHTITDSHSNPNPSPRKLEQGGYRNNGNERTRISPKTSDRCNAFNHSAKSLSQKSGGSLRVKGSQVLTFSREYDIDEPGSLQQYSNLVVKKVNPETTNEHRYISSPQSASAYSGRTRSHPRSGARSNVEQTPSTGPDPGLYVKQTSDDRLLFQELKSNGLSPVSKDTYQWSGHVHSSSRDNTRRQDVISKPTSSTFQTSTRANSGLAESSTSRLAGAVDKLSPRATLQPSSSSSVNTGALLTMGSDAKSDRNLLKLPDPRITRPGLTSAHETDEQSRSRNTHTVLRQTPRDPMQVSRKPFGKPDRDKADGMGLTSPVAGRVTDEARKTSTAMVSTRTEHDHGTTSGFRQVRAGSQDDLALCPNAPPRVRRHASVVLLRRSLQETSDGANAAPLTVWNSSSDSWAAGTGVDVDAVAASIKRQPGDQTATLARALESLHLRRASQRNEAEQLLQPVSSPQGFMPPSLPVKKQHYL